MRQFMHTNGPLRRRLVKWIARAMSSSLADPALSRIRTVASVGAIRPIFSFSAEC